LDMLQAKTVEAPQEAYGKTPNIGYVHFNPSSGEAPSNQGGQIYNYMPAVDTTDSHL
jgi:hypothetical protein